MNIFEDIMNDKNVDLNDVDMRFFILKFISTCTKKTVCNLIYGDPRLVVPLLAAMMESTEKSIYISEKMCHSSTYRKIMEKQRNTQPSLNTSTEFTSESLEALQNKLDKGRPGWKHGDPHVIDLSKLEVYDLDDPTVVEKACSK